MLLDDGKIVYFGQELQELESLFGVAAVDNPLPIARKGIDRKINGHLVVLELDTGRLRSIVFKPGYQFKNPPEPYHLAWKNLTAIDGHQLKAGMSRDDFLAYLAAWEKRAVSLVMKKVDCGDMAEGEYQVSVDRNKLLDMIHISMGPTRRTGRGGIWCDGWNIFFTREEKLEYVHAFCDAFNTVARRKV